MIIQNLKEKFTNKNLGISQLFSAFTLAEVLVTLGIIGVVAAMTIPTLVQNIQEKQYKSAAKKSYSALSQALISVTADNGGSINALTIREINYQIASKMKVIDDCGGDINQGCHTSAQIRTHYKTIADIFASSTRLFSMKQFITADGSFWANFNYLFTVDVNGYDKSPNKFGVDVFGFQLYNGRFLPIGADGALYSDKETSCNREFSIDTFMNGLGCTDYAITGVDY